MSKTSVIENVMSLLSTGEIPEGAIQDTMPDHSNHNVTEVALAGNKEIWAEVRRELQSSENELTADLREKRRLLQEEEKAEMDVYRKGDRSLEEMMADGLSREEIIEARSAAQVALEMAQLKQKEIDQVSDEIDRIKRDWITRRDRCTETLRQLEIATRAWLLDLVSGGNYHKLNAEKSIRQYGALLHAEKFTADVLGHDLAARAVRELGTFKVPDNVWDTVFSVMPERFRKEKFDDADHPEKVLKRLDTIINEGEK